MQKDKDKESKDLKEPVPPEFIPTELGSAVFASVEGRPVDREYLIKDKKSRDDVQDGAAVSKEN